MKLSIHPKFRGKPDRLERKDKPPLYIYKGTIINLGYDWENIECTWQEAFDAITIDGLATSCELSSNHREESNYISRQLCMVDIDDGMTIQELFENDFYNEYGAGFYTTARHTDDAHRFRIMFVLEEPEYDALRMRKIIRGLLEIYESGDKSCKDASRIYYGVPNCVIKEYTDKVLPKLITDELVNMIDRIDNEKVKTQDYQRQYDTQYDEIYVSQLLSKIANNVGNLHGQYDDWLSIAWATCHTVGVNNAKNLMLQHWPSKTKKELHAFDSWDSSRSPGIATLIKLSNFDKDELRQMELEFRARNNIEILLEPYQVIKELNKKIRIY
jgi:hypothetical protein